MKQEIVLPPETAAILRALTDALNRCADAILKATSGK